MQQHWAEALARQHLEAKGYRLLTTNHREKAGEIDLVMRDGESLVFVEVRQRRSDLRGSAAESIGAQKLRRLTAAAGLYMLRNYGTTDLDCRFDAVLISGTEESCTVEHLQHLTA